MGEMLLPRSQALSGARRVVPHVRREARGGSVQYRLQNRAARRVSCPRHNLCKNEHGPRAPGCAVVAECLGDVHGHGAIDERGGGGMRGGGTWIFAHGFETETSLQGSEGGPSGAREQGTRAGCSEDRMVECRQRDPVLPVRSAKGQRQGHVGRLTGPRWPGESSWPLVLQLLS